MKKLILVLTILLLISNAFAIETDNITETQNLSSKEIITLILLESDQAKLPSPANKFAPLNLKLNLLDKNESLILAVDKEGNLNVIDSQKYHILIEFNFEELINSGITEEPKAEELLERLTITPNSFKGALVLSVAERIIKKEIVKKRGLGYKTIGVLTGPVSWFIK